MSVIMPVRDGARWLQTAILSVQNQTMGDLELIVIDDGSRDGSKDLVQALTQEDQRVRTVCQQQLGLVAALNRGISESRAPLIARLDADDWAHPQRLERQVEYLNAHPGVGLVGTWALQIDEQGAVKRRLTPATTSIELKALLKRMNPFLHSSVMFRAESLKRTGRYRPAFEGAEDYDLWLRLSEMADVANLPDYLLQYRYHRASVSQRFRIRQLFSTRLAQRAAQRRTTFAYDPIARLAAAPDWRDPNVLASAAYGDIARLFCFLDRADRVNAEMNSGAPIDLAAISDGELILTHAERRMAQLALLNAIAVDTPLLGWGKLAMFWRAFRLHPARALGLSLRTVFNRR